MPNVVLLFPGQGSQAPGMGKDLAARYPAAREVFEAANAALGVPLSLLAFEGPADELTLTHNAQPALLTHGAAAWAAVRDAIGAMVVAAAGHSLGEFTAYHASDALPFAEAVRLVRRRGELMLEAGRKRPGAMAAVLGTLARPIEDICHEASEDAGVVVPANYNCPGQIVISGESMGVDRAMELVKLAGGKAKKLNVSGAFHSPLMEFAVAGLSSALDLAHLADARFPIYANVNAQPVNDAALARRLLLEQLTSPVQWTRAIESIALRHPRALFVEMGPGTVLKGLVKKIVPDATVLSCGTGAEVDALLAEVNA
ncbi:MAG: [acyl-carrier-protein] S-malonyltransferase [Gemmatimonadetes bacterium]|nr:MAG: [acyl-carrier-protein] S-malonyltransferase [Gemmatimonadota bacterium]